MEQQHAAPRLRSRGWVPDASEALAARLARRTAASTDDDVDQWIHALVADNRRTSRSR